MGAKQSKEEIVIAQAGNSGGSTTSQENAKGVSYLELAAVLIGTLLIVGIAGYCYLRARKNFRATIRREIRKSQELI